MARALSETDTASRLQVSGAGPARSSLTVPGDKSISHWAVLLAAMAQGTSAITCLSTRRDVHSEPSNGSASPPTTQARDG